MIELIDLQSDHTVGMRISGKIERPDIDRVYEVINDKLGRVQKLSVYVEVDHLGGITFDALIEDVVQGVPKIFRLKKKAVVSSAKWLEVFTKIGDKLLPSIEARHFTPDEREQAKAWVVA
jgi:hypothetical protein